ncbi:Transposase [Planctomycetes bacterium K23_9]|uniref:Transposase n=1 Tax=Stieleria marina TaxID=1930275 RepID=A0A517NU06_9BACT|nr:Transposase [Planctomycetes bacterium K23_9]
MPIDEVCRKLGISQQTFYRWKKKFAGRGTEELCHLKSLEEENKRLAPKISLHLAGLARPDEALVFSMLVVQSRGTGQWRVAFIQDRLFKSR